MRENELEDLIIAEPKKNKFKNLLSILALLIILIFVGISFVNTLIENQEYIEEVENNKSKTNDNTIETNTSKPIIKEKREETKEATQPKKTIKTVSKDNLDIEADDDIFASEKKENIPAPKNELDTVVNIDDNYYANYTDFNTSKTIPKTNSIKSIKTPIKDVTNEVKKEIIQTIVEDKPKEIKKPIEKKEKPITHKTITHKSIHHKTEHKTKQIHHTSKATKGKFYIQVGSFRHYPSQRFLSVIKNSGFSYIVTKPNAKSIRRLLIGSYSSRAKANIALKKVKDRINKHSYIIKR